MIDAKINQHGATLDEVKGDISELKNVVEDILVAVNQSANQTQEQFEKIDQRFQKIDERFERMDGRIGTIECMMATKADLEGFATKKDLEGFATKDDLEKMETRLVTKDYLDVKMSDLRGDLVVMVRKEDTKLKTLVGVLAGKNVIDQNDVKKIYSL
jgi:hypothetical protein